MKTFTIQATVTCPLAFLGYCRNSKLRILLIVRVLFISVAGADFDMNSTRTMNSIRNLLFLQYPRKARGQVTVAATVTIYIFVYIYIYICVCVCVYIHIYINIHL